MLSNVNLNLLRSLHVLLEEQHVSKAAQRLHVTQSAVSRQLSQLRELFNDALLVREGNKLVPTPRALDIQIKLVALFKEFDHLLDGPVFEPEKWKGEIVFSSSDYVAQYIFPEMITHISASAPYSAFKFVMWERNLLPKLAETGIHLATTMLSEKPDNLSGTFLGEDKSVLVMCKDHPLSERSSLKLHEILDDPYILITGGGDKNSQFEGALSKQGKSRKVGLKVPFFSAAFNALAGSRYLLVVPEHIAQNACQILPVTYRDIPLDMQSHKYWLIWHPKFDGEPAHRWMREQVYKVLKSSIYSVGYDIKS